MSRKTIPLLALWLAMCSSAMGQRATVVFELEPVGDVDSLTTVAATQILRDKLNATGKFTVIPRSEVESKSIEQGITHYSCRALDCALAVGAVVGAECAVMGTLTRSGDQGYLPAVTLYDLRNKRAKFSANKEAGSRDDLDNALSRLARALETERSPEKPGIDVTEREKQEEWRKSHVISGLAFGFGAPSGDSYSKVDNLKSLNWIFRYEVGHFVLANSIGLCWGKGDEDSLLVDSRYLPIEERKVIIVPWDILVHYIVNRKADFSPFVGAGAGFHFILPQEVDDGSEKYSQGDQALAVHLSGGLYAFQSYDIRLVVEARYTTLMTKAFGEDSGSSSQQIGLYMGIAYKL